MSIKPEITECLADGILALLAGSSSSACRC